MELRLGKRIGMNALGRDIRRTYSHVVFFRAGGRNIATVMVRRQKKPSYVSFKDERKRPLWKQSMDLQMGHRSHRGRRSGRHAVRGMDGGNVEKRQKDRRKRILRLFFLSSCHRLQRNSFSFHLVVQRDNLPFHLPPSLLAQKRHRLSLTGSFYLFRLSLWNSLFLLSFFSNVVPAWLMPSSHLSETVTVLSLRQSVNYSDL